uniref:transposase n=1 Tax=Parafrankia discariae TaxID=365528 RepID=UPI0038996A18
MTKRVACSPAPGPLEDYAARFDDVFSVVAQRRGFREYLTGLLASRDRNKTSTCLAGAEPVVGAQHPAGPLRQDRQRRGHGEHGVGARTGLLSAARPALHPGPPFPAREKRSGFPTRPQIAVDLIRRAPAAGRTFRAVVADCAYGDHDAFRGELFAADLPFVMALKPHRGTWAYGPDTHTPRAPPASSPGTAREDQAPGRRSDGPSVTDTPPPGEPPRPGWAAGAPTASSAWSSPPPTRPGSQEQAPGTWRRTCPVPARHAKPTVRTRPPTSPNSSGSTGSATGSSRATNRSRTNSAGPISRSVPTSRSASTRPSCTARSRSAGRVLTPSRNPPGRKTPAVGTTGERGRAAAPSPPIRPPWPVTLRAVRD